MTEENSGIVETEDTQTTQETTVETPETPTETPEAPEASSPEPEAPKEEEKPSQENNPPWLKKRLEREKSKYEKLEGEFEAFKKQFEESRREPEKQLTREDFGDDYEGYQRYIAQDVYNKQESQKREQQAELAKEEKAQRALLENWYDKVDTYKEKQPDYAEVVQPLEGYLPKKALMDLLNSDSGPEITYHLAKNPNEAEVFASMDDKARDRYIIRKEALFEFQRSMPQAPAPTPPPVNPAPAPLTKPEVGNAQQTSSLADFIREMDEHDRRQGIHY